LEVSTSRRKKRKEMREGREERLTQIVCDPERGRKGQKLPNMMDKERPCISYSTESGKRGTGTQKVSKRKGWISRLAFIFGGSLRGKGAKKWRKRGLGGGAVEEEGKMFVGGFGNLIDGIGKKGKKGGVEIVIN